MEKNVAILHKDNISVNPNFPHPKTNWKENTTTVDSLIENIKVNIQKLYENELEFDLVGVPCAIANVFRRIMLVEIPTMAIEKVYVKDYKGVVPDECIAHRLGLIPIKVDAALFDYRCEDDPTSSNTIVFKLTASAKDSKLNVTSGDLEWIPYGDQKERFKSIRPVNEDIVITKLAPCELIDVELFCEKGIGLDHIKWSPVCLSTYRMLPEIELKRDFYGHEAKALQSCFSPGVIAIHSDKAVVVDARSDSCSREHLRNSLFQESVILKRKTDHLIFSIESLGIYSPESIFQRSVKTFQAKLQRLANSLEAL